MGYYLLGINIEDEKLLEKKNSPLQLISQLKGFFYINPFLALSLSIGLFSLMGIPPLVGFFAKQMVLSAALQNGYIFLVLVGILTSVIGAVYYLGIIKIMFFNKSEYTRTPEFNTTFFSSCSSSLTMTVSVLTLMILLFIISPTEWLSIASILALSLFNP